MKRERLREEGVRLWVEGKWRKAWRKSRVKRERKRKEEKEL